MRSYCFYVLIACLSGGLLACVNIASDEHSHVEIIKSSPQQVPIDDMQKGPIALFEDACARCHGPFGSFYGEEFAKLEDEHLEEVIFDMMIGPSQLDVTDTEIEAMTDYHRALNDERMFVSINNGKSLKQSEAKSIKGDKSPSSNVLLKKQGITYQPKENLFTWELKKALSPPFEVIVKKEKKQESFHFPHRQWNHVKK